MLETILYLGSDSESSEGLLSKKPKIQKAELAASSKEEMEKPTAETSEPRKRPAENPKAKPVKKSKTHQESGVVVLKPEPSTAIDVDDIHLESSNDVSFFHSSFSTSLSLSPRAFRLGCLLLYLFAFSLYVADRRLLGCRCS